MSVTFYTTNHFWHHYLIEIVICEALLRVMRAFGCDTENLGIKEQNGFKCRRRFCLRIGFQLFSANLF